MFLSFKKYKWLLMQVSLDYSEHVDNEFNNDDKDIDDGDDDVDDDDDDDDDDDFDYNHGCHDDKWR